MSTLFSVIEVRDRKGSRAAWPLVRFPCSIC